jgi:hypothetical protein
MNAFAARTGGLMRRPDVAQTNAANWNRPGGGYDQWRQGDPAREQAMPIGTMLPQAPVQGMPPQQQPGALDVPPIQPIGVQQPQQPMNAMAPLAQNGMGPVQPPPIQPVGPQLPGGNGQNLNALRARLGLQ